MDIVNLVDDSVAFQTNSMLVLAFGQFYSLHGPRILRQRGDLPEDAARRSALDAIASYSPATVALRAIL
jgi:hypothetical protein